MKISRVGSSANHGRSFISIKEPKISWNKSEDLIQIRASCISDFSTDSRHDYTLDIGLDEIASILKLLGDRLPNEVPEVLASNFSPVLREIIRLEKVCIGSVAKNSPEEPGS